MQKSKAGILATALFAGVGLLATPPAHAKDLTFGLSSVGLRG